MILPLCQDQERNMSGFSKTILIPTLTGLIAIGSLTAVSVNAEEDKRRVKAPAAKAIGEPRTCIPIRSIKQTKSHDDYTIDFELRGGKVYRNDLVHRCGGLGFEKAFTYSTSLNQLCRGEIITVISTTGPGLSPRGSCGLNKFQEIELIPDDEETK